MRKVTTAEKSRETDKLFMNECGIPGIVLMENAAFGVIEEIMCREGNVLILCGPGNNGGDGFAILRGLKMRRRCAISAFFGDDAKLAGDALINFRAAKGSGCEIMHKPSADDLDRLIKDYNINIIVDALFGTGFSRDLDDYLTGIISLVNSCDAYRIAVDMPTGVNSDTGEVCGTAFRADCTVTMQSIKRGQLIYPGRAMCGIVRTVPIGCSDDEGTEYVLEAEDLRTLIPKRRADSHKGTYGKVLIIGGSEPYAGAACISSVSALRGGAGLVKTICSHRAANAILTAQPEIMTVAVDAFSADIPNLDEYIAWSDAIAVGMGAGSGEGLEGLLRKLILSHKKLIIDADGLNCIARNRDLLTYLHDGCILTPHIGEFSRLCMKSTDEISKDLYNTALSFAQKYNVNLLVKSSTSLVVSPCGRAFWICAGNSGLAKGGSGDSLSGLTAAFASGGMDVFSAGYTAALFQGVAAQMQDLSEYSVTISDISSIFSKVFEYASGQ